MYPRRNISSTLTLICAQTCAIDIDFALCVGKQMTPCALHVIRVFPDEIMVTLQVHLLRYYEGNFDSDKYRSGTDYSVDLLKMEQTNVQTKYVRQVWRRSVAAARPAPRAGPAGIVGQHDMSTHMEG